jgi:hypothetical protein
MQFRMAPQTRGIVSALTYSKTPLVDAESISERVDDLPGSAHESCFFMLTLLKLRQNYPRELFYNALKELEE